MTTTDAAIRLQIVIEQFKTAESKIFLQLVDLLERNVESFLRQADFSQMSFYEVDKALSIQNENVQNVGEQVLARYYEDLKNFIAELRIYELRLSQGTDHGFSLVDTFQIPIGVDGTEKGKNVLAVIHSWWSNLRSQVFGYVRRSNFEKKTNLQILADLKGQRALRFKDGIFYSLRRFALSMNGALIQHLSTMTRESALIHSKAKGIMWNAMLERSVCSRCRGLDLVPFSIRRGPRSPLHYGCRCFSIPILSDTVIERRSYYSWLETQPRDFIESVLGKKRSALFLKGGLSAKRFAELQLDKKFEPLTLEEIKKTVPEAFTRAGL